MPDFQTLLEEKDNKVACLSFLMGCSETAYWLVCFLMPLILCIPPYLLFAIMLSYGFGFKGYDVTLLFVLCMFFVISHLWFMLWISTFMKFGSAGKAITVGVLILAIFFAFLHQFFTLDENNGSTAVKHAFSIVPLSAFELVLMGMYAEALNSQPPMGWGDITRDTKYPIWYGLMWLGIDSVLFFLLFMFFNLMNGRQHGTPLIGWSNIFNGASWKRLSADDNANIGKVGAETEDFLSVKGLCKTFSGGKDVVALKDVDFTIQTGEVIVMIGPNGAGKSTLINVLAGAVDPSKGRLKLLGGQQTSRFKDVQRYLGIVFQENVIIDLLSIREHFYLFGAFRGIPMDVLEESIDFYAHTLQLTDMLDNRAGDLSGGQKRKLCISLSMLGNPPIVIMDEPTAGVDVQARQLIWKTIASFKETTSIITSHALEEAEAVSSRLFILSRGTMPFAGTSTELREKHKCGYLLRVEREDGKVGPVLELAQQFIPSARPVEDREDMISIPVDGAVPQFLSKLVEDKEQLGVMSYSFAVEQLEDMLLKLIQTDEAAFGQ
jgi:ABC-type multidrug transport system ATPase subunit